jgi:hypothetical protein
MAIKTVYNRYCIALFLIPLCEIRFQMNLIRAMDIAMNSALNPHSNKFFFFFKKLSSSGFADKDSILKRGCDSGRVVD